MLTTIAPMFLLLIVGFLAGFSSRFRDAQPGLNAFVFYFGLPTFVYSAVSRAPGTPGIPLGAVVIAVGVTAGLSALIYLLARVMSDRAREAAAPTSLAGTFGNVGYFGIPISISTVGPEAALAAGLVHLLHNILYMTGYPLIRTAMRLRDAGTQGHHPGRDADFRSTWRRKLWPIVRKALLFNPVALAIVLALLSATTGVGLPEVADEAVDMLGGTAVPVALFAVGLAMHPALEGIRSGGVSKRAIVLGTAAKILILPLLTWAAVLPLYGHLGPVWAAVLVIMAAVPSSTTVFILSEEYDGDGRLAAAILVTSTALSLVTLPLIADFMGI